MGSLVYRTRPCAPNLLLMLHLFWPKHLSWRSVGFQVKASSLGYGGRFRQWKKHTNWRQERAGGIEPTMARERSHLLRSWLFSSLSIWHLLIESRVCVMKKTSGSSMQSCLDMKNGSTVLAPTLKEKQPPVFLFGLAVLPWYCQVLSASTALQRWPPSWRTSNLTHHGKKGPDIAYFVYKWNFLCGSSGIVFRNQALCQSLAKHVSSAFHHAFFKILLKLLSKTVHNAFNLHRVRWNN